MASVRVELDADPTYRAMKQVDGRWPLGQLPVDATTEATDRVEIAIDGRITAVVCKPQWRDGIAQDPEIYD